MTTIAHDPITGAVLQLAELATRFPDRFIEGKAGNAYVAHHVINQRLLSIVGPFDFELVREIRGDVAAAPPDPDARSARGKAGTPALSGIVVGVVGRLTCEVDGRRTVVEEIGDVGDVHNWAHDGARLKDAASDALKRCAMRLGLGLHLWAQEHYFLDRQLSPDQPPAAAPQETAQTSKPGGASVAANAEPATPTVAEPRKAPDPSQGPVAAGTPPGFDHLTSPGRARAWLRGQPEQVRELVDQDAKAAGIDLDNATLAELQRLILVAWTAQQAA